MDILILKAALEAMSGTPHSSSGLCASVVLGAAG